MGEEFLLHAFKSKCEFQVKVNDTVTADIEAGVKKMIEFILQQLKQRCPEFEVADIIPTGSFYEGTKIGAPDEFDFMLTLAKLSVLDKISLHPGCSAWYPHIKLQPEVDFPQHYKVNVRLDGEQSKDKDFLGNPSMCNLCEENEWKLLVDRPTDRQQQSNMPSLLGRVS